MVGVSEVVGDTVGEAMGSALSVLTLRERRWDVAVAVVVAVAVFAVGNIERYVQVPSRFYTWIPGMLRRPWTLFARTVPTLNPPRVVFGAPLPGTSSQPTIVVAATPPTRRGKPQNGFSVSHRRRRETADQPPPHTPRAHREEGCGVGGFRGFLSGR